MSKPQDNDLLNEVEDRAANPPKLWDPESRLTDRDDTISDPSVAGLVEEIDTRESGYGPYKVTVLRRRDGSRAQVAWFGTVLEARAKNLAIGDAVALTFKGRTQPKDPSLDKYADFDVIHRKPKTEPKPSRGFDWSEYPAPTAEEMERAAAADAELDDAIKAGEIAG